MPDTGVNTKGTGDVMNQFLPSWSLQHSGEDEKFDKQLEFSRVSFWKTYLKIRTHDFLLSVRYFTAFMNCKQVN